MQTWLFWDLWHIEHQDNIELCQGQPEWQSEATYEDPGVDYLGFWPTVYRDESCNLWRMLYFGSGFPLTLMGAESEDGIHWRPLKRDDIHPGGEKLAANHLFTVEAANGGPVYLDPARSDGRPFKFYCIQRGGPAAERAQLDEKSYFHEIVTGEGVKPWVAAQLMASSADGLRWRIEDDVRWGRHPWHPDPPICCFFNHHLEQHTMLTRPGWGDRRIAVQTSPDARNWSGPELLMQPDPVDPPQVQFYGMPVVPYEGSYVGFLWVFHSSSADRLRRFNQLWGRIDSQLVYSFDGSHFQRGTRECFIPLNPPGLPGSGVIYPTCLVEVDGELRIYSAATRDLHHQYAHNQFIRKGGIPPASILLHTLRKDGFTYLSSAGNWARFISKPLALSKPELRLNALAPHGEVRFQISDLESHPINGFTFDECVPFREDDCLDWLLRWRHTDLGRLLSRPVRLEVLFRHARIYAFRGEFHFLDALDVALLEDGKEIALGFMDC